MAALGGEEALRELSEDLRDLCIPRSIERLDASRVLEFLRRFAGRTPCILSGVLDDSLRWGLGELRERLGAQDVTVDATPDGHGDCVRAVCAPDGRRGLSFVMPEERRMPFNEFCDRMEMPQAGDDVLYYSRQNDNMRDAEELASLFEDGGVPGCLPLAAEAFGNAPDAVNLWIGDERAVSSAHRDPYENFYCVLSGTKTFDLLPPPAVALLDEVLVPPSRLRRRGAGAWAAVPTGGEPVRWATGALARGKADLTGGLEPLRVEVRAGETLYLPALWWHRVSQTELTVALNYWHDLQYDQRWAVDALMKKLFPPMDRTALRGADGPWEVLDLGAYDEAQVQRCGRRGEAACEGGAAAARPMLAAPAEGDFEFTYDGVTYTQEDYDFDDGPLLPFCGEDVAHVEYGSLNKVAPYVATPAAALRAAVQMAGEAWDQGRATMEKVAELGCGKGEFIRALADAGWCAGGAARRVEWCCGIDIAEDLLADARSWARTRPEIDLWDGADFDGTLEATGAPRATACFARQDLFEAQWWAEHCSLLFVCLVPRMLSERGLVAALLRFLTKAPGCNRVVTSMYDFAEDSPLKAHFVRRHEHHSICIYCAESGGGGADGDRHG